jgi:hypothetical protein
MGEAHQFEREFIDHAIEGVESAFAEYDFVPTEEVRWPGWRTVIERWGERTWLRADDAVERILEERRGIDQEAHVTDGPDEWGRESR